jgi:hypothetical protein
MLAGVVREGLMGNGADYVALICIVPENLSLSLSLSNRSIVKAPVWANLPLSPQLRDVSVIVFGWFVCSVNILVRFD